MEESRMRQTLTGFLDQEGILNFEEQVDLAKKHNINDLSLRYYNHRPLIEAGEKEIKLMLQILKQQKMKVVVIDTLIYGYDIHSERKFNEAFDQFKYMVKLADRFKVTHLMLRIPKFIDVIKEYELIKERLKPFIDLAYKNGKKIIFVPDQGYRANTYAYLVKKLRSSAISVLFDPVYFLTNKESTTTAYRLLKKKMSAFACHDQDFSGKPKLIGYGKTDMIGLFKRLLRDRFTGFLFIDNQFYKAVFEESEEKEGFFKKFFSREKKRIEAQKNELSRRLFPNEETKNVTYDDILDNQIKVLKVIFKK